MFTGSESRACPQHDVDDDVAIAAAIVVVQGAVPFCRPHAQVPESTRTAENYFFFKKKHQRPGLRSRISHSGNIDNRSWIEKKVQDRNSALPDLPDLNVKGSNQPSSRGCACPATTTLLRCHRRSHRLVVRGGGDSGGGDDDDGVAEAVQSMLRLCGVRSDRIRFDWRCE